MTADASATAALPLDLLACPACRAALVSDRGGAALRCAGCAATYAGEPPDLLPASLRASVDGASSSSSSRGAGPAGFDPSDVGWARWREAIRGLDAWRARRAARASADGSLPGDGASDADVRALFARCNLRAGAAVLDVGARDGGRAALLPGGARYVGVDPFPAARRSGGALVVRGVAEALPVRDASVDAVVSLAAFDYFADGQLALREMARVLRPGGALALLVSVVTATVANARGARSRTSRLSSAVRAVGQVGLAAGAGLLGAALLERDRPHTHYYTRAQLTAMIKVRFDIDAIDESPQPASTILYINARKRRLGRLPVIR